MSIYPKFFFDGGYEHMGGEPNDLPDIKAKLDLIPNDLKEVVCLEYEILYLKNGREQANSYLQRMAESEEN